jgi:hypothetical protein
MASNYPGSLDSFNNPSQDTLEDATGYEHDLQHANANDAIEAIQGELGTDPAGLYSTVKARLDAYNVITPEAYGATGNGSTDDQTALTNAIAALNAGDTLLLTQTYKHSATLTVAADGVTITGGGTLKASDETNGSAVHLTGDRILVDTVTFEMATQAAGRQEQLNDQKVTVQGTGIVLRNVLVNKSMASGIFFYGATDFVVEACTVQDTLADGFHSTNSCSGGRFVNCLSQDTGDDGFAVVSYGTDTTACSNFVYTYCRAYRNAAGRGFSVVGGTNVTWKGCYSEESEAAAFYVACETSYSSYGVDGVSIIDCEAMRANRSTTIDQGALFIYCSRAGYTVQNVTVRGFVCTDTYTESTGAWQDIRTFEEAGTVTGIRIESADIRGTITPYPFDNPSGNATVTMLDVFAGDVTRGWERLAGQTLASAASTFSTLSFPAREHLMIVLRVVGMASSDTPAIRFNADTGNNYRHRHITCATGGTTLANVEATSQNRAHLSGNAHTEVRQITMFITNKNDWQKVGSVLASTYSLTFDVASQIGWSNTSAQITSATVLSVSGNNFNAGSSVVVFGKNAT